jgi:hypothetical protein
MHASTIHTWLPGQYAVCGLFDMHNLVNWAVNEPATPLSPATQSNAATTATTATAILNNAALQRRHSSCQLHPDLYQRLRLRPRVHTVSDAERARYVRVHWQLSDDVQPPPPCPRYSQP